MPEPKYIDIKEFQQIGFLQEVNRQFFHPLGLALAGVLEEDGSARLAGILDYRDDPEGCLFGELDAEDVAKAERVEALKQEKADTRLANFGYVVQPIGEDRPLLPLVRRMRDFLLSRPEQVERVAWALVHFELAEYAQETCKGMLATMLASNDGGAGR